MKKILQFAGENDNDFFIEINEEPSTGNIRKGTERDHGGGVVQHASQSFEKTLTPLKKISSSLINQFKDLANSPDEVEIELYLKFAASAGIILSSLDSSAHLKIVLKWQNKKADH